MKKLLSGSVATGVMLLALTLSAQAASVDNSNGSASNAANGSSIGDSSATTSTTKSTSTPVDGNTVASNDPTSLSKNGYKQQDNRLQQHLK